jgi:hypothetical protein
MARFAQTCLIQHPVHVSNPPTRKRILGTVSQCAESALQKQRSAVDEKKTKSLLFQREPNQKVKPCCFSDRLRRNFKHETNLFFCQSPFLFPVQITFPPRPNQKPKLAQSARARAQKQPQFVTRPF